MFFPQRTKLMAENTYVASDINLIIYIAAE